MTIRSNYRRRLKKGDVLLQEGEKGTELFVLEKGTLDVFIQNRKVGEIDARSSQEFVGEVAALLGEPRTATVVASTECLVLAIPQVELEDVLMRVPSLGAKLARSLCKKLSHSAHAHALLKADANTILQSGSTDISLRNYMKGLLFLVEVAEAEPTEESAKHLGDYFRKTNPWGIQHGEAEMVMEES